MWASIAASSLMKLAYRGVRRRNAVGVLVYKELGSRTAINQTLARKAERPQPPRDYRLHDHFRAPRRGEDAPPLRDASGYLVYPTWLNWCASAGRWLRATASPVSRPVGRRGRWCEATRSRRPGSRGRPGQGHAGRIPGRIGTFTCIRGHSGAQWCAACGPSALVRLRRFGTSPAARAAVKDGHRGQEHAVASVGDHPGLRG